MFKSIPKEFLHRYATDDETYVYWYTPEIREQSKQVNFNPRTYSEKVEYRPIDRKDNGHPFLVLTMCDLNRPGEEQNRNWTNYAELLR